MVTSQLYLAGRAWCRKIAEHRFILTGSMFVHRCMKIFGGDPEISSTLEPVLALGGPVGT